MDLWQLGVGEDDVVLRYDPMPNNLIGCRRAAENVEGPVGAEDARCVALGVAGRADVVEPGAERRGRDAEVRAQKIFAEEAMELLTDGMLEERDAAHVAGRVPGVGALVVVLQEFAEVGRQKLLVVALDGGIETTGDEGRGCRQRDGCTRGPA